MEKTSQRLKDQKAQNESLIKRIFITVIIMGLTTMVQLLFYDLIAPAPYLLFYPSMILASLYGEGISAVILSTIIGQFLFVKPYGEFKLHLPNDLGRVIAFATASYLIMKIIHNLKEEKIKVEAAVILLKQRETDLQREKEAREKFVWTLNHDLKNPLTALRINAQMLGHKKNDEKSVQQLSEKQLKIITRMDLMINDLLDANKISAGGHLEIELEEIDLVSVVENTIQELELIHGKRFVLKTCDSAHGHWSEMGVRRILENLCSNSVKYGDEKTYIEVNCDKDKSGVTISVNKKGPVIPEAEREELFHPFKRASTAELKSKKGWGLGLTLVKGLSEAMGGHVSFTSDEFNGTTFSVFLPFQ